MSAISAVRRLVTMDSGELRFRVSSEARKAVDRARHSVSRPRWDRSSIPRILDASVSPQIGDACHAVTRRDFLAAHQSLAAHFRLRSSVWPLNAQARSPLVAGIVEQFPAATDDAIARGDRIAEGRFDLLGYRGVEYGSPPDWHLDAVHGRRPPRSFWASVPYLDPAYGDHKVIWELNRHQHWMALGRAFWLSGDPRFRDAFVRELQSWIDANPPLTGVNWASMLELAFRSISWTWAIEFFAPDADGDREAWLVDLLMALDRQLEHVADNLSRYFSPNTHLSGEALALYAVSQALPELRRSRARAALGRDVLVAEASRQIRADGGHVELSAHYHRYSTDFYVLALLIARASRDPAAVVFERAARAQAEYLRTISDDNGQLPLLGDDDGGQLTGWCGTRPTDASVSLGIAASVLRDSALAVRPAAEEVYWWIGDPAAVHETRVRAPWPSKVLNASGYFVSRTAGGDHLIFDAGPHGFLNGGHAHSDALSVLLSVRGQPLLVDPGTATYTMDPHLRNRLRATRMHNTVVLDGRDHAEPRGPFHWETNPDARLLFARTDAGFDFAEGTHDAYAHASHVRSVLALHGIGWMIVDHVFGDDEVAAEAWWHIHPSWSSSINRTLAFSERARTIEQGDWSVYAPEYGRVERAPAICLATRGRPPFSFAAFIPSHAPSAVPIEIRRVAVEMPPPPGWVGSAFHITGTSDLTVLLATRVARDGVPSGPEAMWGTSDIQSDARVCAVRGTTVTALIGGQTAEVVRPLASAVHVPQARSSA
jgi:hypothetical protein